MDSSSRSQINQGTILVNDPLTMWFAGPSATMLANKFIDDGCRLLPDTVEKVIAKRVLRNN